jgi:hypothetical protein
VITLKIGWLHSDKSTFAVENALKSSCARSIRVFVALEFIEFGVIFALLTESVSFHLNSINIHSRNYPSDYHLSLDSRADVYLPSLPHCRRTLRLRRTSCKFLHNGIGQRRHRWCSLLTRPRVQRKRPGSLMGQRVTLIGRKIRGALLERGDTIKLKRRINRMLRGRRTGRGLV